MNQKWHDLLPAAGADLRPAEWRIGAALPAPMPRGSAGPEIWFIDSAWHGGGGPESVIDKICRGVESIITGATGRPGRRGRPKPLVALPTLGVGRGGLGEHKGRTHSTPAASITDDNFLRLAHEVQHFLEGQ